MSKDIRSFFSVVSKKPTQSTAPEPKKKAKRLIDSDDEDVIESTPERSKTKQPNKKKPLTLSISSDSDDEPKNKVSIPKKTEHTEKLIPININDYFGDKPIKQSKVEPRPKVESIQSHDKPTKSKKKKSKTETGIHEDDTFEKTLLELDDDILTENLDVFDKTIDEALSTNIGEGNENKQGTSKDNTPKKLKDKTPKKENEKGSKRQRTPSEGSTPKKPKLEHTDSGIDPDQEVFEKRRYSSMLYQKYKNRGGPRMHGQKEIPKGNPDCLKNMTFVRTGVLDSLEEEEFQNLIAELGGKVVKSVSKKVNYIVVGEDPGPSKLEKSKSLGISEINEDELFDLILVKSGKKPRYVQKSDGSEESGIFVDDFPKSEPDIDLHKTEVKEKHSKNISTKQNGDKPNLKILKTDDKSKNLKQEKLEIKKELKEEKLSTKTDFSPNKETLGDKKKNLKQEIKEPPGDEKENLKQEIIKETKKHHIEKEKSNVKTEQPTKITQSESLTWTEKYKPTDAKSVIGQQGDSSNLSKLRKWLNNWYRNQLPEVRKKIPRPSPWAKNDDGAFYKAALLSGPPGVGKTTTATLVSKELGFDIVEFNASDTRSKKLLQEEVSQLLNNTTIAGFAAGKQNTDKKRVLLMDEVDGMAGNEDRGGIQELINLIKNTNVPIICMCNDRNHQKMRSIVNYCFDLRFTRLRVEQIRSAMMSICFKEGLALPANVISEIIAGTGCDIRQTLNHLTMYAASDTNNSLEQVQNKSKESKKDTILGPWEVVRCVFTESEQKNMTLSDKSRLFFYDYSLGPLFVQENYLGVTPKCPKKEVLKRAALAADAISRGDLIDAKIRGSNNWALLESQAMCSSVLPGYYMSGNITSRINFPGWLGKNSSTNKRKRLLAELHSHTRMSISGSALAMKLDYLVPLRNAIITPMLNGGLDGIPDSIRVMKDYSLLREDLNNLIELCQWKDTVNPFNRVDPKVKAAFTRAYNKEVQKLPFAPGAGFSKKKVSHADDVLDEDDETIESDDPENDNVNADALIKVKSSKKSEKASMSKKGSTSETKASTSKTKAAISKTKAATSKTKESAKGKEKTKKAK